MIKKIALITSDYPSPGRPSYIFVEQLTEAMVDLGIDVTIIAPQSITRHLIRGVPKMPRHSIGTTKNGNEYQIYRPYYISVGNCSIIVNDSLRLIRQRNILKILNKIDFDCIYCHFWENVQPIQSYALKYNIPVYVACGEGDEALEELNARMSSKSREKINRIVKGVISVSSENKRKCIKYGLVSKDNVNVFPNCVDTHLFQTKLSEEKKRELGIKPDDFTIVFVGGFIYRKGARRVSQAITQLHDDKIKSIFIGKSFAGDCEEPDCEGIVFKGIVNHDSIPDYLNCADAFVLPTLKEGCCNAIVESLATCVPVISSKGTFNDDIINETNSIRIDPLNIDEIAAAIKKMKSDVEFRQQLIANMKICREQYSIIGRAKRILNFMNDKL